MFVDVEIRRILNLIVLIGVLFYVVFSLKHKDDMTKFQNHRECSIIDEKIFNTQLQQWYVITY